MKILLLFLLWHSSFEMKYELIKSTPSSCQSYLWAQCPNEPISRRLTNKLRCTFTKENCKFVKGNLKIILDTGNSSSYPEIIIKSSISYVYDIKPYALGTGSFIFNCLFLNALDNNNAKYELKVQCFFSVKIEKPTARIKDGLERYVAANEPFDMDGESSRNNNDNTNIMTYLWTCVVQKGDPKACKAKMSTSKITVPAKYAIHNSKFLFTLKVTSEGLEDTATQTVYVKYQVPVTKIECLKNCPPAIEKTDTRERTVLQVQCEENCGVLQKGVIEWKVMKGDEIVVLDSEQFLINDELFMLTIEPRVLDIGKYYTISSTIKDFDGGGSKTKIFVEYNPEIGNCKVEPNSGVAKTTNFRVQCEYDIPGDNIYKIYSVDQDDSSVLLSSGPLLDNLIFKLPEYCKVKLEVLTPDEFSSNVTLDVEVLPPNQNIEDPEETVFFNGKITKETQDIDAKVADALSKKNYKELVHLLNAQNEEISNLAKENPKFEALKLETHNKILDVLQYIPIEYLDDVKQIVQLAVSITDKYDKADPNIAAKATEICKEASHLYYDTLDQEKPKGLSSADETLGYLMDCLSVPLVANQELIEDLQEKTKIPVNVTSTPYPALPIDLDYEHYDDYYDDEELAELMNQFEQAIDNVQDICYVNGKIIAKFIIDGEGILRKMERDFIITVYKDHNEFFRGSTLEAGHVTIRNSNDKSSLDSNYVVVCTSTTNGFWWLPESKLETAQVMIRFNDNKDIEFSDPYIISFPVINKEELNFDYPKGDFVYNGMTTYRIDVFGSYHIFFNITDEEDYTILVTKMRKPTLEELQTNGSKVNSKHPTIFTKYTQKFHSWHFLNILKDETKENPRFNVKTFGCFKWNEDIVNWQFVCPSSEDSTDDLIVCKCRTASILKGQRHANTVRLEVFHSFDFDFDVEPEYAIALATIITFFIFIQLYICVMFKNRNNILDRYIIFLVDTPHPNKYAYLIIVNTEKGFKHGTTSNVSIRLIGEEYSSLEHVLNYPDPGRMFLQQGNEDWFIMAEKNHLGKINEIEIWYDSVGIAPNWKCTSIEIYDLQTEDHWYFPIRQLFSLQYIKEAKYVAKYVDVGVYKNETRLKNIWQKQHFWIPSPRTFDGIPAVFRLITVYSIVLSNFFLCVVFHGLPKIEVTDGLTPDTAYVVDYKMFGLGVGSSLIVFIVHCPLVILFRRKNYHRGVERIIWLLLIGNIILCNIMLLVYGLWMAQITSFFVLSATTLGILFYIFVLEYLMKLTIDPVTKINHKAIQIKEVLSTLLEFVEMQRNFIFTRFGLSGLRPYLMHFYEALTEDELKNRQEKAIAQRKAIQLLEDLTMYLIYIVLLYVVLLSNRKDSFIFNNIQLNNLMWAAKMHSLKDFHSYVDNYFIESMQGSTWYPYYVSVEAGLMSDKHNSYFGVARFRQGRTPKRNCSTQNLIRVGYFCRSEYYMEAETRNFSKRWKEKPPNLFDRLHYVWLYVSEEESGAHTHWGKVSRYDGGGYIAPLGRTYTNSHRNFEYYSKNKWIDFSTRFLVIEYLSYNVHTNLFNAVKFVNEFSVTGAIHSRLYVETANLLTRKEDINKMILPIMVAFMTILCILSIRLIHSIYRKRKNIFKIITNVWLLVDASVIVISVICLILFETRTVLVGEFLSEHEAKHLNEFVPYINLFFAEWILTFLSAILIVLATLRLWKLLRFIKFFQLMERTLTLMLVPFVNLYIGNIMLNLAFGLCGFEFFGESSANFKTLGGSMVTLMLSGIGQHYEFDFSDFRSVFHYLYYISFSLLHFVIINMYIALIIIYYREALINWSITYHYSLTEYLKERIIYFYELIKFRCHIRRKRIRGGQDGEEVPNVSPRFIRDRYSNCIALSTHKMRIMSLITQTILLGRDFNTAFSDQRCKCLTKLIHMLNRKPIRGRELFYATKFEGQMKIVEDHRMLEMERIANVLLDSELEDKKKKLEKQMHILNRQKRQMEYFGRYLDGIKKLVENVDARLK